MARPFSFAGRGAIGSPVVVSRKTFRIILVTLLVISAGFAAWSWMRPYEWSADPEARCRVTGCEVRRDHSNYWLTLHLKVHGDAEHNLELPVRLQTAAGNTLEPADTTLVGDDQKAIREIWLKFWLEKKDFKGPLKLSINGGQLTVRSGNGEPSLRASGNRYYVSHHW